MQKWRPKLVNDLDEVVEAREARYEEWKRANDWRKQKLVQEEDHPIWQHVLVFSIMTMTIIFLILFVEEMVK